MDLATKIQETYTHFKKILDIRNIHPEDIYISWTGGKDSTTVLYLWMEFLKKEKIDLVPKVFTIDTGFTFPEIFQFINDFLTSYNFELKIVKPKVDIENYPKSDVVLCCKDLKITPLKEAVERFNIKVVVTGVRRDENILRKGSSPEEYRQNPDYIQLNPILHWTEKDIWAFHVQKSLPYCVLYDKGFRSIDCIPCTKKATTGERTGRNKDKEKNLSLLHSLGYF